MQKKHCSYPFPSVGRAKNSLLYLMVEQTEGEWLIVNSSSTKGYTRLSSMTFSPLLTGSFFHSISYTACAIGISACTSLLII